MTLKDIDRAIITGITETDKKVIIRILKVNNIDVTVIKPFYCLILTENKQEFISFLVKDEKKVESIILKQRMLRQKQEFLVNGYHLGYAYKEDDIDSDIAEVLRKCDLHPNEPLNICDTETAISALLGAMAEYLPSMDTRKLALKDWRTILSDYESAIIDYHPDNSHQERWALEQNQSILKRCGATGDEIESLEFS